ncbi:MAG: glycosyl transferase GT4 family protein, partial [Promethearchaeota archaeon]
MKILAVQATDWIRRNPAQQHHLSELLALRGHEIRVIDFEILWKERKGKFFSKRRIFKNVNKIHKDAEIMIIRPFFIRFPVIDYISVSISQIREINVQIKEFQPDLILGIGIASYWAGKVAQK